MDIQALTLIGAVIAIVGSLLGAVLAIDQLTAGYRYRRRAEFLRATLGTDTLSTSQRDILTSVHGETVGRILAATAIPTWGLWGDTVMILLPGGYAILVGRAVRLMQPISSETTEALWVVGALSWALCWYGTRHALFALRERARLTRAYRRGRKMIRANRLHALMDGRGVLLATGLTAGYLLGLAGMGGLFALPALDGVLFVMTIRRHRHPGPSVIPHKAIRQPEEHPMDTPRASWSVAKGIVEVQGPVLATIRSHLFLVRRFLQTVSARPRVES